MQWSSWSKHVFERDDSHAISCAISRQEKGGLHKCIARFITYSSPGRADTWFPSLPLKECTGVRYVITIFLGWMVYQIFLPMVPRWRASRAGAPLLVIGTMEVSLKIFTILLWSNFPMKNTVVSKESTVTLNCWRKVININKKEQGSQNTSLRHAICYLRPTGRMAINYYSLSSCSQEIWNPFQ